MDSILLHDGGRGYGNGHFYVSGCDYVNCDACYYIHQNDDYGNDLVNLYPGLLRPGIQSPQQRKGEGRRNWLGKYPLQHLEWEIL